MFWMCLAMILALPTPAHAATHNINLGWYYGRNSEFAEFYNGEAGTKLGQISLTAEDGTFDYRAYAESPEGANFYMYYGVVPIIRVNGNYYMLQYIFSYFTFIYKKKNDLIILINIFLFF